MPGRERVDRLFCYGTLEFAAVMRCFTGCDLPSDAAVLKGYVRRPVRGEVYPGIVPDASSAVGGTLYRGLDARLLRLLDRYESTLYRRRLLEVEVSGTAAPVRAWVYVVSQARRDRLAPGPWDAGAFESLHLAPYLRALRRCLPPRIHVGIPVPARRLSL